MSDVVTIATHASDTAFRVMEGNLVFMARGGVEMLRCESNGDIFVRGRLVENDREVVDGLRAWLKLATEVVKVDGEVVPVAVGAVDAAVLIR